MKGENMPRLEGQKTNPVGYIILFIILALAALWILQYYGYIHIINGFGRQGAVMAGGKIYV
jgi:hypothetical protein